MGIGAGELLLIDGLDVSDDATRFEAGEMTAAVDRTAIAHTKRQRVSLGLDDDAFAIDAFWEPGKTDRIFQRGTASRISHIYGLNLGDRALTFPGIISPKKTHTTPVGELQLWSTEGTINGAVREGRLFYRTPETVPAFSAGRQMLFSGAGAQYADIGLSAADRTIQLIAHVTGPFVALGTLSVYEADAPAGPWTKVSATADISLGRLPGTPGVFVGAEYTGALKRYVGADLVVSEVTAVTLEAANLGAGVHGFSSISGGAGSYQIGGRFHPATPPGLVAILSHDATDDVEIIVTNDADPLGEDSGGQPLAAGDVLISRVRPERGGAVVTASAAFVSRGAVNTILETSSGAHAEHFVGGMDYRVSFRHGGQVNDFTLLDGDTDWEATCLVTVR